MEFHIRDLVADGRKGANVQSGVDWHCPPEKALGRDVNHAPEGQADMRYDTKCRGRSQQRFGEPPGCGCVVSDVKQIPIPLYGSKYV